MGRKQYCAMDEWMGLEKMGHKTLAFVWLSWDNLPSSLYTSSIRLHSLNNARETVDSRGPMLKPPHERNIGSQANAIST